MVLQSLLGTGGRGRPRAQVLTLQIIRAMKLPPNHKRERTTGKERVDTHNALGYIDMTIKRVKHVHVCARSSRNTK